MRKIIIVGSTILLLGTSFLLFKFLSNSKKQEPKKIEKVIKTAYVDSVENKTIPIIISANGTLVAKDKVELFSEVQGVLQATGKEFKPGTSFSKGQTILRINSDEHFANLQSQKSNLQNLIASIMPDIRLDYPNSFEKWNNYLMNFDINKTTLPLPEITSNQEKYFVTGKNIFTTYYAVKNLEARLYKFNIRAPFSGIVTEANVRQGALVRSGQKMGEFISTNEYELEVAINVAYADILKKGRSVTLHNLEKSASWEGTVSRINGRVDQNTQTITIFISVKGERLHEGMYLEASVTANDENNVIEISRKLLVDMKAVYVIENKMLKLQEIAPVYFDEKKVFIRGLKNGVLLLNKPIPGAYEGMEVKINTEK